MILQALKEYYDRKVDEPDSDIAPEGFERKEIPFLVVINSEGHFVNLEDTRERIGNRLIGKVYLLPRSKTRTGIRSYATTFMLWDHIGYLFGHPAGDLKATNQHHSWLRALGILPAGLAKDGLAEYVIAVGSTAMKALPTELWEDEGVKAIRKFYESPDQIAAVRAHGTWAACLTVPSCNMTFILAGDSLPIPCRKAVRSCVQNTVSKQVLIAADKEGQQMVGLCLVTGNRGEIAKTHGRTPINKDTKSLIAFQKNSGYDSNGKEQGYNAPVSKSAEFAYTTALNTLLKSKHQRVRVGDAATVFWSARKTSFEHDASLFFDEPPKDDPDRCTSTILATYASIWSGAYIVPDDETKFYVLGLAPNAARIAVRFWHVATVKEIGWRFNRHINDLTITHGDRINPALPVRRLLHGIAPLGDDGKLPPRLAGDMMRAILEGLPYPHTLWQAAICRIRAEHDITYPRAALIKACINRATRYNNPQIEEELKVSLDPTNNNIGYRLGRLFAVLEKIQAESSPGINATIRDRFYGAASSTPVTVFGNLMRLNKHHLSKLEHTGRRIQFEQLIAEIMDGISDFPSYLRLEDQGRFAIGYYHQMQSFYTKKSNNQAQED